MTTIKRFHIELTDDDMETVQKETDKLLALCNNKEGAVVALAGEIFKSLGPQGALNATLMLVQRLLPGFDIRTPNALLSPTKKLINCCLILEYSRFKLEEMEKSGDADIPLEPEETDLNDLYTRLAKMLPPQDPKKFN